MKIIDEKGKLFGRANIIDILVILLLILAAVAVGVKFKKAKIAQSGNMTIQYTVKIQKLRQQSVDAINSKLEGIIDAESGKELGKVISIDKNKATELVKLASGEYTLADYDDRYDLTLTIQTPGSETGQGFYSVSGKQLMVGDTIGLSNGVAQTFGEILSVEVTK